MKPELTFGTMTIRQCDEGCEDSVPDLAGGKILQNELSFRLGDEDEVYEAYGRCRNSYPYRQRSCYSRTLREAEVKTAVLENDFLKAVFLPEEGGRLWSLWDKEHGRDLVYVNDVLRYSNLAVRNAWFSGGVEWNIGVIGHTPLTTEPLFVAELEREDGTPVLRMYEYERIRRVTWQIDFWLGEKDRFLNARMRIYNFGEDVVPMYWWSNIAVPQVKDGRVITPAHKAYTHRDYVVQKVDIPMVDGIDVTKYEDIPFSVDYFFELDKDAPRYIASVDKDGNGLLHMSTDRLQSRKLFSWGQMQGGHHWQEFLTDQAGEYLEIQAGLAKTQYGCIPMAPHTAWEWLERYGAIQVEMETDGRKKTAEELREQVTEQVRSMEAFREIEDTLQATKAMAKRRADRMVQQGSGFGALAALERQLEGKREISGHLDFGECQEPQRIWQEFLKTGVLADPGEVPPSYMEDGLIYKRLLEYVEADGRDNWYAWYQLGLFECQRDNFRAAQEDFRKSLTCKETPWAYHGLASACSLGRKYGRTLACVLGGKGEEVCAAAVKGVSLRKDDLSYVKDCLKLLSQNGGYGEILEICEELSEDIRSHGRVRFYEILALEHTGREKEAWDLLLADGGLVIDDMREDEGELGELWQDLHRALFGTEGEVPYPFDFRAV